MTPDSEDQDFRTLLSKLLKPQTPREIRASGLVGLLVGAALFVPGVLLLKLAPFLFTRGLRKVTGVVFFIPYVMFMTGIYRLVTGQNREDAKLGFFWSLLRITLAVVFIVVTLAVVLFVVAWAARD